MTDVEFLQEVKRHVPEIDPQAEVWLSGSRARGDDSDWDFLVLTEKLVDRQFKYKIWNHLNDLELDAERLPGAVVHNKYTWQDLVITHLYQNIQEDGIAV